MASLRDLYRILLQQHPIFSALSDEALQRVLRECRIVEFSRAQMLFVQGDPAPHFFFVLDGWVTVYRHTPDGRQTVLHVVQAGETFAEPAALNLGYYPASAEGASEGRLLQIPVSIIARIIHESPDLAIRIIGLLSQRMRRLVVEFERLNTMDARQRLAAFLLDRAPSDIDSASVSLPYDKSLVAARLGMSPETLSRALAKLRDVGVLSNRQRIEITDVPALKAFAERQPENS